MSQLAIDYFTQIVHKEVSGYFEEFCGVSLPPKLVHDADVVNALTVAKKAVHSLGDLPKIFIRELCLENMVPFKKYPEAYPYNQEANIKFIKKVHEHHDLSAWINGYEKICGVLLTEEFEKQNKQMALFYQEVIDDYQKLDENMHLYIFDYSKYPNDWKALIKGKYSKFTNTFKKIITEFFDSSGNASNYIESYIYPSYYHDDIAEDLNVNIELLKTVWELCDKPNLEKETLKLKIVESTLLQKNNVSLSDNLKKEKNDNDNKISSNREKYDDNNIKLGSKQDL